MARLEVVKGVSSQRVWFEAQEGRPSSTPSVEIKDQDGNTIQSSATTYVTQDTVNTTPSSAGSVADKSLTLTAVTGIEVRKSYLVTNSLLQKEWVRVRGVNSSTKVVTFDEPLEYAHDTSATFQSTRFYYTLQTTDVDTLEELWRARASYTVDSLNYIQEIPFDVVLTPLVNPLTVQRIKQRRPDIMQQQHSNTIGEDHADLRAEAWEVVLQAIRDHGTGWRPALVRTPADLEQWALAEFDLIAQENGLLILRGWEQEQAVRYLAEKANTRRETSLNSLRFLDFDEDDAQSADEQKPIKLDLRR